MKTIDLDTALATLRKHAQAADGELVWPRKSWQALACAGVLAWNIPRADGGSGKDTLELLEGYERIASACLTTCFILSQRESAARHLRNLSDPTLRRRLLAPLATGKSFATVGLSQLTTSRQHQKPVLSAREKGDAFILDGTVPWVTGAAEADYIVFGAVTDANLQILGVLPTDLPGVEVGPPLDLVALRGSLTAEIRLRKVKLDKKWLIAGPVERVLASGKGGAGGLETSCLAIGLTGAATTYLFEEAKARPDLEEIANNLENERRAARCELHRLAQGGGTPESAAVLRAGANTLVLRATQAALTVSKGAGFLCDHPAQRWARQALFFLVWSCPRPTFQATLAQLAPGTNGETCL